MIQLNYASSRLGRISISIKLEEEQRFSRALIGYVGGDYLALLTFEQPKRPIHASKVVFK